MSNQSDASGALVTIETHIDGVAAGMTPLLDAIDAHRETLGGDRAALELIGLFLSTTRVNQMVAASMKGRGLAGPFEWGRVGSASDFTILNRDVSRLITS